MKLDLPPLLQTSVDTLIRIKAAILIASSLIMAFVFFFVVLLRYLFDADLFAYEEWILVIAFWMYFIGGAMGSYENTHIKADFLLSLFKSIRSKWLLVLFTQLLELGVSLVLTYCAWLMVADEISAYPQWQKTAALEIPFLLPRVGIFLGFCLMTFYIAMHLYSGWRQGPTEAWAAAETQ